MVVLSCCAPYCGNTTRNRFDGFTPLKFHKFPHREPERVTKWLQGLEMKNFTPNLEAVICSVHFLPTDYVQSARSQNLVLKKIAVPSVSTAIGNDEDKYVWCNLRDFRILIKPNHFYGDHREAVVLPRLQLKKQRKPKNVVRKSLVPPRVQLKTQRKPKNVVRKSLVPPRVQLKKQRKQKNVVVQRTCVGLPLEVQRKRQKSSKNVAVQKTLVSSKAQIEVQRKSKNVTVQTVISMRTLNSLSKGANRKRDHLLQQLDKNKKMVETLQGKVTNTIATLYTNMASTIGQINSMNTKWHETDKSI